MANAFLIYNAKMKKELIETQTIANYVYFRDYSLYLGRLKNKLENMEMNGIPTGLDARKKYFETKEELEGLQSTVTDLLGNTQITNAIWNTLKPIDTMIFSILAVSFNKQNPVVLNAENLDALVSAIYDFNTYDLNSDLVERDTPKFKVVRESLDKLLYDITKNLESSEYFNPVKFPVNNKIVKLFLAQSINDLLINNKTGYIQYTNSNKAKLQRNINLYLLSCLQGVEITVKVKEVKKAEEVKEAEVKAEAEKEAEKEAEAKAKAEDKEAKAKAKAEAKAKAKAEKEAKAEFIKAKAKEEAEVKEAEAKAKEVKADNVA